MSKECPKHHIELTGTGTTLGCQACAREQMAEFFPVADAQAQRNARVQARYDELQHIGKHGHYETMFQVVREEVERALRAIG